MFPNQIEPGRSYKGCSGQIYHVEEVDRGTVKFRVDKGMVRVSIDLDTFGGLMKYRIEEGHGD